MRALVTGGAGFIGSHVCDQLVAAGIDVVVVDDLSHGSRDQVPPGVRLIVGDVRTPEVWQGRVPDVDVLIHLAGQISVASSETAPVEDASINYVGTLQMLQLGRQLGCREFRFASSAAVYGNSAHLPLTETMTPEPVSFYGISKWAAEVAIFHFCRQHSMAAVVLRLANVYGTRQRAEGEGGVVAVFARALAGGTMPTMHGDGQQTRDFIAVTDVARAFTWELGRARGQSRYNVSSGQPTTVEHVWRVLAKAAGVAPEEIQRGPVRPGDIRHSVLSPEQLQHWGWSAEEGLSQELVRTLAYFRSQVPRGETT